MKPMRTQMTAVTLAALCFWTPACAYQIDPPSETELITFEELDPGEAHLEPFDLEVPGEHRNFKAPFGKHHEVDIM